MVVDENGRHKDGKLLTMVEGNYCNPVVDGVLGGERLKIMRWIETMDNHVKKESHHSLMFT